MEVSVELTMSPLRDDYEQHIINFIKKLRASKFKVLENPLSTQIFGEYQEVMVFLTEEIGASMKNQDAVLFYMKMVKSNRSDYEPFF